MNPLAYHVLLEGRRMGPYDRRTIVGLRIKNTLTSEHRLEASDGSRLSVAELVGRQTAAAQFNPMLSGSYSAAKATCSAWLIDRERGPAGIPAFRGEVEVRVHADVLRIAGRHRHGFALQDVRVKLPLNDIAFFRTEGSRLDLWLRSGDPQANPVVLQRLALDLFSDDAVRDLMQWIPGAQRWPEPSCVPVPSSVTGPVAAVSPFLWVAVFGVVMVAGLVLLVLLRRRF